MAQKLTIRKIGLAGLGIFAWLMISAGPIMSAHAQPPATEPSVSASELQLRANTAMAKSDWAAAIPILQRMSQLLSDQPDQLGMIQEELRVCRRQLSKATTQPAAAATGSAVGINSTIKMTLANSSIPGSIPAPGASPTDDEARVPHVRPAAGSVLAIDIKDLGNFDYDSDKGGNIPDDVKKLEGVRFRTHGFMVPLDQAEHVHLFALVPSLFACCFGQPPQVQHTLVVSCPAGKAINFFPDELTVEGTLHVTEQKDGGVIISIFQVDAMSITPAEK
jgi:hypothetical protein